MALTDVQAVNPHTTETGAVRCECGQLMIPKTGRQIDSHRHWLFWQCIDGHVTRALPLPNGMRVPDDATA